MALLRYELEFDFETFNVNIRDTILIPTKANRDTPLEDMDIADFGLVRYSDPFPLRYAGVIPMRFLLEWDDDTLHFENWAHGDGPERVTVEDIYSILQEIDDVTAKAPMTREEHAVVMGNMAKIRDFVACVAQQTRTVEGDEKAKDQIDADKVGAGVTTR